VNFNFPSICKIAFRENNQNNNNTFTLTWHLDINESTAVLSFSSYKDYIAPQVMDNNGACGPDLHYTFFGVYGALSNR
jgi:hypothetical protein